MSMLAVGACSSSSPSASPGTGGSGTGGSSAGGSGGSVDPALVISNFEDTMGVVSGTGRNGYWYSYNDNGAMDATHATPSACAQTPAPMAAFNADPVPDAGGVRPGSDSAFALHTTFMNCTTWGAGIGADLAQPPAADGGTYTGPKAPYDVTQFTGITFWARQGAASTDTKLRVKLPMRAETKTVDGGNCLDMADGGTAKCSDDFGENIVLSNMQIWKQFTVKFADTTFKQEGWGTVFPWDPKDVTSIQIQSQGTETGQPYDFWVDDFAFTK